MSNVKLSEELRERHRQVRAGFIVQGTTLQEWCRSQGLTRQNVDKALLGQWRGPKANEVVKATLHAAAVKA